MHSIRSEYLAESSPSHTTNGHSDGHGHANGNGHGHAKVFSLKPALDPATEAILAARDNALADQRLCLSARAAFCKILDLSLDPRFFDGVRGVVTLSDPKLGGFFGKSERTAYTWKRQLTDAGYVWITKKYVPNMYPITTYHLSCLHRPRPQGKTDDIGTYGSGKLRPAPAFTPLGARKPGQPGLPLPGSRTPAPEAKNEVLQGISALNGEKLPLSPEENCGSEPKKTAAQSRNKLRLSPEINCGSEPQKTAAQSRNKLPLTPEADCRLLGDSDRVETVDQRLQTINRLSNRAQGAGKKQPQRPDTQEYLERIAIVLGRQEIARNAGLHVKMLHDDPRKAWACLNETEAMRREKRIRSTPAKAFMDLYTKNRL